MWVLMGWVSLISQGLGLSLATQGMRGPLLMGRLGPLTDGWTVFLWEHLPALVGWAQSASLGPFPICEVELGDFLHCCPLLMASGAGAPGELGRRQGCSGDSPQPGAWEGARCSQAPEGRYYLMYDFGKFLAVSEFLGVTPLPPPQMGCEAEGR